MARIAGINLPREKRVEISLTYILGTGRSTVQEILDRTGIDYNTHVEDLTEAKEAALHDEINHYAVEGSLRRNMAMNIKRLREINCYRGIRHRRELPVRGQKTKTDARTHKGPRKLVTKKE